ncbi:(Fe-S)-binding protein [Naasia aerilata]|uniref:4Fe-4S ferredoxin-type domain-containing protein n=1 Tax=Naasia aerilata TaxID=1162966 RepID=A0ABM8GGK6_9MICO|nr:4Fe-4S dicluster domain-containing protein [Naasia aerilata]BDZ47482.1 hypothetical protein GCM10025866_33910 [Naasia aerilata]
MAPFVERQYGAELYAVIREIKTLFDPLGLLNPGVLVTDDRRLHLKDLKTTPAIEQEVDRCVECGYCDPVCPSRDLTTTPRQRIVLRRELERARADGDQELMAAISADYEYDAIDTCAVDGMCQSACPVLINTGDLVRRLRAEGHGRLPQAGWTAAARHWDVVTSSASRALTLLDKLPAAVPRLVSDAARKLLDPDNVPRYTEDLPPGGSRRPVIADTDATAVYFSSCTTTMFGTAGHADSVRGAVLRLAQRAGVRLATPDDMPALCCGTPGNPRASLMDMQR